MTAKPNYMTLRAEKITVICQNCSEEAEIGFDDVSIHNTSIGKGMSEPRAYLYHASSCKTNVTSNIAPELFEEMVKKWFENIDQDWKKINIFNKLTSKWQDVLTGLLPENEEDTYVE